MKVDAVARALIAAHVRKILIAIGEDPDRPELCGTPARVAGWWAEFIDHKPGNTATTFDSSESGQLIVVSGIRVWSLCEHHLLPFWCDVAIGYVPHAKILGLSKFARIAHDVAHALQVQERLTIQIADRIENITRTPHVAVLSRGEHLCMSMRGVKSPAVMSSSVMRGSFHDDPSLRAEFLSLVK